MSSERALLWDIDGTLIDTTTLIVAALDHIYTWFIGRTIPSSEIRAIIGIPLKKQVSYLGNPQNFHTSAAEMEAEFIRFYEANRQLECLIPEAISTLIAASESGIQTGVVTSKNDEELANTLPRLGIREHVQAVVGADQISRPKPDPEGVLLALKLLNASAGSTILIGDTVHDMRAAKAAGVRCCAVTWGAGQREALLAEKPDMLCDCPDALASVLLLSAQANIYQ